MKKEMKNDDEFYRYKIRRILSGHYNEGICEQIIHISYFDKRLWNLIKYLVYKNKFNLEVTQKLVKRRNPNYSQKTLFEYKVKILSDLFDKKSSIRSYLRCYLGLPETEEQVIRLITKNEPKAIDFEVVIVQGMINQEILKIYRKVQEDSDLEDRGMSRMYHLKRLSPEEREIEIKEYEDYDAKMSSRIKRVPC